jgi:hypothetical protein
MTAKFKINDWVVVDGHFYSIMSYELDKYFPVVWYKLRNFNGLVNESRLIPEDIWNSPLYKALREL